MTLHLVCCYVLSNLFTWIWWTGGC